MAGKRYVLLKSGSEMSGSEAALVGYIRAKFGEVKAIPVDGNPRALILKTTADVAAKLKGARDGFVIGGRSVAPVLTSGAVGNLKRRAAGAARQWRNT